MFPLGLPNILWNKIKESHFGLYLTLWEGEYTLNLGSESCSACCCWAEWVEGDWAPLWAALRAPALDTFLHAF